MSKVFEANSDFTSSPDQPVLSEVGVIALVPDEWQGVWQLRHQILTRLSQYFNVVWCNPAPMWHKSGVLRKKSGQEVSSDRFDSSGFTGYHPERWLPTFGRPRVLAHWTMRERLRRAQRVLRNRGCRKIILYLWRPGFASALDLIDHDLSCYHIDDEYTFSTVEIPISEVERKLLLQSNQVFIHSPALLKKKGGFNPHTTFVPNGVDYQSYATPCSEPEEMRAIPRPRVGYVGTIKMQLNLALLLTLAKQHPEWSFVFVGPQRNKKETASFLQLLKKLSNVFFLGPKAIETLPAYTQHMDVCMMCYELNDYTKFIYPLKLHEYLATGRPVIGSPINSLREFANIITLARTPTEWSNAIKSSLSPAMNSIDHVNARRQVAQQYDWKKLVGVIAYTLSSRLGSSYQERIVEFTHGMPYVPPMTDEIPVVQ